MKNEPKPNPQSPKSERPGRARLRRHLEEPAPEIASIPAEDDRRWRELEAELGLNGDADEKPPAG